MLSERERKTLEEIERHLREDDRLSALVDRSHRREQRMHRFWLLLLIASGVLLIAMIALASGEGAAGSLLLGALSAVALYFSPRATGSTPERRSG